MDKHRIKGDRTTHVDIDTFKDMWTVDKSASITSFNESPAPSAALIISGSKNTVIVDGDVNGAMGTAINVTGSGNTIEIGRHGHVFGGYGIRSQSVSVTVVNDGNLDGSFNGTELYAFYGSGEADTFINHGRFTGTIYLADGNDVADFRNSRQMTGTIAGGYGDDTLITDDGRIKLTEIDNGGSRDTVKSSDDYVLSDHVEFLRLTGKSNIDGVASAQGSYLYGNAGNNHLTGLAGYDNLFGGRGNDVLTGGLGGPDGFFFGTGDDKDKVMDFEHGVDDIYLQKWKAIQTFHQLKTHADDHNGSVWIQAGHDTLIIHGMTKHELDPNDFFF